MASRITLRLFASSFLAVLTFSNTCGQEAECSQYAVPLVMRNAQGEMVHNYSAGDVAVSVGGGIVAVDEIHRERRLRRVVIVLDASGSMREDGGNPWQHAVMSASVLANLAEGRARLALLIFNEKIIEEVGFDRSNLAVEKRLKDLQSNREKHPEVQKTRALSRRRTSS